jgi:hypothetical protein
MFVTATCLFFAMSCSAIVKLDQFVCFLLCTPFHFLVMTFCHNLYSKNLLSNSTESGHAMTQNHIYCKTFWNIEKVHRAKNCSFTIFFRLLILILRFIQFEFWHSLSVHFRCQSSREGNLDSADMESNSSKNSRDYWSSQQVNIMTL